jgi:hypothetical protein
MIGGRFLAAGHAIQAHRAVTACLDGVRGPGLVVSFAGASTQGTSGAHDSGGKVAHGGCRHAICQLSARDRSS